MSTSKQIVSKLWTYCNILRDDGLSYPDYVEQLTYLIFLKMASEQPVSGNRHLIPKEFDWSSLTNKRGKELHTHYAAVLDALASRGQMLGLIFGGARNRIRDPEKLRRLIVELIDKENWTAYDSDVKGDAYEGLLEKTAQDSKSGAGQYFTPRPLIRAIVEVLQPQPMHSVCDPACGTCGFLLGVREHIARHFPKLTAEQERHQRFSAFHGVELVESVARLGAMNLYLHGIGPSVGEGQPPITIEDSLLTAPSRQFDLVLTNPPFGKKSSMQFRIEASDLEDEMHVVRRDFWAVTTNKQINFLQHAASLLAPGGRAAVVLPDNVLFERGVGETIRRKLFETYNVHTLLRLPSGLFYAQGVKANVLFFDRPKENEKSAIKQLWVYDLRTDMRFTLKNKRLQTSDLAEFIDCYGTGPEDRHATWTPRKTAGRWRPYNHDELSRRPEFNLDITWLTPADSSRAFHVLPPDELALSIVSDLRNALTEIEKMASSLAVSKRKPN